MWTPNPAEREDDLTILRNRQDVEIRAHNTRMAQIRKEYPMSDSSDSSPKQSNGIVSSETQDNQVV